jgi:ABC-type lipoprotein release transport system permease subunit
VFRKTDRTFQGKTLSTFGGSGVVVMVVVVVVVVAVGLWRQQQQ